MWKLLAKALIVAVIDEIAMQYNSIHVIPLILDCINYLRYKKTKWWRQSDSNR